jgi:hypothetical protein
VRKTKQRIDRIEWVATVNQNVVVTFDGLNRDCSEIAHPVGDGRLNPVAIVSSRE